MADGRIPPHNISAERALIGAVMLSRTAAMLAIEETDLDVSDFYSPNHQVIWATIQRLHVADEAIDVLSLADALRRDGVLEEVGDRGALMEMQTETPSISNAAHYVAIIRDAAMRRRMIYCSAEIADAGYNEGLDLDAVIDVAEKSLLHVTTKATAVGGAVEGLYDDARDMIPEGFSIDDVVPWVIPGLLRQRERMIVVAGGGAGKSTLLRQFAHCAANGIHPWNGKISITPPQNCLVVELEAQAHNIDASTRKTRRMIANLIGIANPDELENVAILHRPQGMNLRDASDRTALIGAIRRHKPTLVCIGPLKYMYRAKHGETFDETAVEVQRILNELSVRYGFAVVIESHSSKSEGNKPAGSERWVDWPDLGFTLTSSQTPSPYTETTYDITPFRYPRNDQVVMPETLLRNGPRLPWAAADAPTDWFTTYMNQWTLSSALPFRRNSAPAKVGAYMRDPEEER